MTNKEWIELFFSESFEKQINDLILEDIDFLIPRESILNYVLHVIDIPYNEYLDFVSNLQLNLYDKFDIPYFEHYAYCESDLIEYILSQDNKGCTDEEIGIYFACKEWHIKGSTAYYGSKHLYSAKILGLVYEYYNHWYLNCIGYIYGTLSTRQRNSLLARTILRSPFFRNLFSNLKTHVVYFENYMKMFSDRFVKMHLKPMMFFSDICVKEAHECNIVLKIKSSSKKYKTIGDVLNVDSIIPNNASKSLKCYFEELKTYPIINDFDIRRLLKEYRNGNSNSLSLIVKASQLTVIRIALTYKFAPLEDIIEEGNVGVMSAINCYDLERVKSFYGFLSFWVKRTIQTFSFSYPYIIHIPLNKLALLSPLELQIQKYVQENEFMPSISDLVIDNEEDFEKIANLSQFLDWPNNPVQLHDDMDCFESNINQIDNLEETDYNSSYVNGLLNGLKGREEIIVRLYYGIGVEPETLVCISDKLNLTRERARQILVNAIIRMRKLSKNNDVYDDNNISTTPNHDVKALKEANIGDYIEIPEQKQIARVINTLISNGERIFYLLGIKDRKVIKIAKDGTLLSDKKKKVKNERSTPERKAFLKSLYGGDNKSESNTKTPNVPPKQTPPIILDTKRRNPVNVVTKPNTITDTARIGDTILYDKRRATVVEKRTKYGFTRLIIRYDNGTFDNVPNDTNRYRII